MTEIVITAAKRTPVGAFLGALAPMSAPQLGSVAQQSGKWAARNILAEVDGEGAHCSEPIPRI